MRGVRPWTGFGPSVGENVFERSGMRGVAEGVRFELTKGCPLPVFKTGAIDHSANLPTAIILRLDCVRVFAGYKTDAGPDYFRPIAESRCAMAGAL